MVFRQTVVRQTVCLSMDVMMDVMKDVMKGDSSKVNGPRTAESGRRLRSGHGANLKKNRRK